MCPQLLPNLRPLDLSAGSRTNTIKQAWNNGRAHPLPEASHQALHCSWYRAVLKSQAATKLSDTLARGKTNLTMLHFYYRGTGYHDARTRMASRCWPRQTSYRRSPSATGPVSRCHPSGHGSMYARGRLGRASPIAPPGETKCLLGFIEYLARARPTMQTLHGGRRFEAAVWLLRVAPPLRRVMDPLLLRASRTGTAQRPTPRRPDS